MDMMNGNSSSKGCFPPCSGTAAHRARGCEGHRYGSQRRQGRGPAGRQEAGPAERPTEGGARPIGETAHGREVERAPCTREAEKDRVRATRSEQHWRVGVGRWGEGLRPRCWGWAKYFQCTVLDASHDTMSARQSLTLPNTRRQGIGRMRMPGLGGRVKRSCQRIGQHETLGQPNLPERGQVHGLWNRNAPNGRRQGRDRGTDVGVRNCKAEAWAASFSAQWCGTRHWAVSVPTTRAARSQERQGRAKVRHFPVGRAPGTLPQCGEWM